MSTRKILILGVSEEMIPLMALARSDGYHVLGTDRNSKSPGLAMADTPFVMDSSDFKMVIEIVNKHKPEAILTRSELLLPVVAEVCELKGLPGPSSQVAEMSVDKYIFRKRMSEAGLRTPAFVSPESPEEITAALELTGLPAIVKPIDIGGSAGVQLVNTLKEATEAWIQACSLSVSGKALIEELIQGREFSAETWTENNLTHIAAITAKVVSNNGHFVELRHTIPAELMNAERHAIEEEVQKMSSVMGLNTCITHTEVMLTASGPVIVETGARPGGDMIGLTLVEMATGINMNRIMLNLALGKPVPQFQPTFMAAAIQYVATCNKTKAASMHDSLIKDDNFARYQILREDDPGKLEASSDRLAYYLFRAADLRSLNRTLSLFDDR